MSLISKDIKKSVYYRKKKELVMTVGDAGTAKLFGIIGGENVRVRGKTIRINVAKIPDVETALDMIEIVTDIK